VTIDLPDELLAGIFKVPEPDLPRQVLIELACSLYARGALTHAQGSAVTGLDRFEFAAELQRREIPIHYTGEDLKNDLTYGGGQ
jgi:predicted HTH domain antitoxin